MIFLVFPKKFELNLFLYSLCENDRVITVMDTAHLIKNSMLIRLVFDKDSKKEYNFCFCLFVNESDIGFAYEFLLILQQIRDIKDISQPYFILCGTCGGEKLGECFQINYAVKFDRGALSKVHSTPVEYVFDVTHSKRLTKDVTDGLIIAEDVRTAVALCGNFIMNCPVKEYANHIKLSDTNPKIAFDQIVSDMETFDFFKLCSSFKVEFACVRIVSDTSNTSFDELKQVFESTSIITTNFNVDVKGFAAESDRPSFTDVMSRLVRKTLNMAPMYTILSKIIPTLSSQLVLPPKHTDYGKVSVEIEKDYFIQRQINECLKNVYRFPTRYPPKLKQSDGTEIPLNQAFRKAKGNVRTATVEGVTHVLHQSETVISSFTEKADNSFSSPALKQKANAKKPKKHTVPKQKRKQPPEGAKDRKGTKGESPQKKAKQTKHEQTSQDEIEYSDSE